MPSQSPGSTDTLPPLFPALPRDEDRVVAFLRAGVPLTLLLDLAGSDPHSRELYAAECS